MNEIIVPSEGVPLGRARVPGFDYPRVVTVRDGAVYDITAKSAPTVRDIAEGDDPAGYVSAAEGVKIGELDAVLANSWPTRPMPALPRCCRRSTCRR